MTRRANRVVVAAWPCSAFLVRLALVLAAGALVFNLIACAAADRRRRPAACAADEREPAAWAARVRAFAFELISIYSRDDSLVVPPSNVYCPGAFNIEVRGPGHMSLLFSRRIYELVRENLAAEAEPARHIS